MRFLILASLSATAFAQDYFSFGEGFSLSNGEQRLQVSARTHTAPSLTEFQRSGTLVDRLEIQPNEIRLQVGDTLTLDGLRVTAYGPDGSLEEHVPLTFSLEGPAELLDFEDWRVHGEAIRAVARGDATIWVASLAKSSTGVGVTQAIRLKVD